MHTGLDQLRKLRWDQLYDFDMDTLENTAFNLSNRSVSEWVELYACLDQLQDVENSSENKVTLLKTKSIQFNEVVQVVTYPRLEIMDSSSPSHTNCIDPYSEFDVPIELQPRGLKRLISPPKWKDVFRPFSTKT